jgi:hypothetical protein
MAPVTRTHDAVSQVRMTSSRARRLSALIALARDRENPGTCGAGAFGNCSFDQEERYEGTPARGRNVATLEKGRRVYLEGRIELSEWTDRDGKPRAGLKVTSFHTAETSKIGRRREREPDDKRHGAPTAAPAGNYFDDEIPFAPEWR